MPYAELCPTGEPVIDVGTAWTERELVRQVPGARWDPERRMWTVPAGWAQCVVLRGVFGDSLRVGPRLNEWVWAERRARVDPALTLRDADDWPADAERVAVPVPADRLLRPFQEVGAAFAVTARSALIADSMGAGKTVTVAATLATLGGAGLPALVICPNSVKISWDRHVREWVDGATSYVVRGGAVGRRKVIQAAREDPRAVVIVNIEAVRLLSRLAPYGSVKLARCRECDKRHGEETLSASRCEVHRKELNGFGFRTVVLDEAHRVKDPSSKQTRACWQVMHDPSVRYRYALTGTPIANHVGDLWSVMHAVAPADFPTRGQFVDRFALQAWNHAGGLDIVGVNPQTRDEFHRVLDPRFRRMTKDRVLPQLPPKVYEERYVDLSPSQLRAYREVEAGAFTVLDDGQVLVAPNNLVVRTRLLQFSSSYAELVPDPRPDDPEHTRVLVSEPSPKIDELVRVLDDLGDEPCVIVAPSRQLIEMASKRLADKHGLPHGLIVGGMTDDERAAVIRRFREGRTRAVLMTTAAGGTGTDGLQHAGVLVRLQRSWSMVDELQAIDRVHRIGSERHSVVTIIDIIAEGTVEQTVQLPRLREKELRLLEITRDRAILRDDAARLAELDAEEARITHSDLGVV